MSLRPNTHLQTSNMNELTFSSLKEIHSNQEADAETVVTGKQKVLTRFQLMVSTTSTENSAEALLMSTRNLLSALKNKVPSIKFTKWNETSNTAKGFDLVPKTVEKAEEFIYNFSRFSKSQKGYYRIQILHDETNPVENILAQAKLFNIQKQQYFSIADSQSINPVTIGLLVGTTEDMINSPDLLTLLKKESGINSMGIVWKYIQTGQRGKFDNNKKALYVETEQTDASNLQSFLQKNLNDEQIQIFGCSITFLPSNSYPTKSQQTKLKRYAPIQSSLVNSIRTMEVELAIFKNITYKTNDQEITTTFAQALQGVQSIKNKQGISKNKILSFYGNLFYAIIPNYETNLTTFQYLESNEEEAESVLNALTLFVEEHFNLRKEQAESYCRSKHIAKARNGTWDYELRSFKTDRDIKEEIFFENLQLLTQSKEQLQTQQKEQYIDPDHQRMLTGKGMDNDSICTNLHQKDNNNQNQEETEVEIMETESQNDQAQTEKEKETSQSTTSSITSINTGSTKSSKAKRYADVARKEMTHQMILKQREHEEEMRKRDEQYKKMEQQLQQLLALQANTPKPNEVINLNEHSDDSEDMEMEETEREEEPHTPQYVSQENKYYDPEDDDLSQDEEDYKADPPPRQYRKFVSPLKDDEDEEELKESGTSDHQLQDIQRRNSEWKKNWDEAQTQSPVEDAAQAPGAYKRKQTSQSIHGSNKKTVAGSPGNGEDW